MNNICFIIIVFGLCLTSFSQNIITGIITDSETDETLIGANITLQGFGGTTADYNGTFEFKNLPMGIYNLSVSYVGYKTKSLTVDLNQQHVEIIVKLQTESLDIVNLTGDLAEFRKTPVSLSNVAIETIDKELAGQEIPTLLNSTPGVYATQQGGGDGDVRINIRGFNQRNVAVMIDGIPMNDMENGWVYWSNWFGLDAITKSVQVQRGLGASKLALPSVGGTINIITNGVNQKEGGVIKQELGSGNYLRTSFGYTTRDFKIGKFTIAGSFKKSDGIVDQTASKGFFYYLKWQKQINNHLFSFSTFGAPQEHGQRKYKTGASMYDKNFAAEIGVDTTGAEGNHGLNYNPTWGEYNNYQVIFQNNEPSDTILGENHVINRYKNYYHKPNFSFQHLWEIDDEKSLTNILYYSNGSGGGTDLQGGSLTYTENYQIDVQTLYDANSGNSWDPFIEPGGPGIDLAYSDVETKSKTILSAMINNHSWFGLLSTFNQKINSKFDAAYGLDIRSYVGEHYREVYDLLGGDYYVGTKIVEDPQGETYKNFIGNNSNNIMLREGDKIHYHNDGLVKWIGGFGQLEYNHSNVSAFINFTISNSKYKRIDYFKNRDIVLEDTILVQAVGINDTIIYDGVEYTGTDLTTRPAETNWENFPGFTFKIGSNWNINELNNIFFNTGILSKAPRFANVFDYNNLTYSNSKNEIIKAFEIGYGYRSRNFALNLNAYHTIWENKPQAGSTTIDGGETAVYNINGINSLHQGIELDFAWKISNSFKYEFLSSIGNWKWNSGDTVYLYLNQQLISTEYFDATGVFVGDSPQTQIGSSINYNYKLGRNTKGYIKLKGVYFNRFFSDYDPFTLNEEKEVWQIPGYALFSLHMGNTFYFDKSSLSLRFNVLNLFNTTYISDAENNSQYTGILNQDLLYNSDATSASVFFGQTRKLIAAIQYKF